MCLQVHCVSVLVASSAVGLAAAALSVVFWDDSARVFVPWCLSYFFTATETSFVAYIGARHIQSCMTFCPLQFWCI